jgi:hypothetical protein
MRSVFVVAPFDGGWCVKIEETGEVLFFAVGGEAERRAQALAVEARRRGRGGEVRVHARDGALIGRWVDGVRQIVEPPLEAAA